MENAPSAATFKSTSALGMETPAVVGSTTMMSLAVTAGAVLVNGIASSEALGAITSKETLLEVVLSALRICRRDCQDSRHRQRSQARCIPWRSCM